MDTTDRKTIESKLLRYQAELAEAREELKISRDHVTHLELTIEDLNEYIDATQKELKAVEVNENKVAS
jgi:cob(I)alamin adenosyltransferase